jgi:hypothetical protein
MEEFMTGSTGYLPLIVFSEDDWKSLVLSL